MFDHNCNRRWGEQTTSASGFFTQISAAVAALLCLLGGPAAAVENPSDAAYAAFTITPLNNEDLQIRDRDRLSFTAVNPFVHRLPSGLKFRGIKLYDNLYLSPRKRATAVSNALGISYTGDGILYYFSPQLLSISLRY